MEETEWVWWESDWVDRTRYAYRGDSVWWRISPGERMVAYAQELQDKWLDRVVAKEVK